jgi:hypothetical protein
MPTPPIIPPPIMTIFPGTFWGESTPVELTICSSSISMALPGNGVTSDPVVMVIFFASTLESPPSLSCTEIVFGDKGSSCDIVDLVLVEEKLDALRETLHGILFGLEHLREVQFNTFNWEYPFFILEEAW